MSDTVERLFTGEYQGSTQAIFKVLEDYIAPAATIGEYQGIPYIVAYNAISEGYLAYIGVPKDLINCTDLPELMMRLDCHGGVTYPTNPGDIDDANRDHIFTEEECETYYWIGWDYMQYQDTYKDHVGNITWTEDMVIKDTRMTIEDLHILLDELNPNTDDE